MDYISHFQSTATTFDIPLLVSGLPQEHRGVVGHGKGGARSEATGIGPELEPNMPAFAPVRAPRIPESSRRPDVKNENNRPS